MMASVIKICPRCGCKQKTDYIFCQKCEQSLEEKWICSNCGNQIDDQEMKFCSVCGQELIWDCKEERTPEIIGEKKPEIPHNTGRRRILVFSGLAIVILTIILYVYNSSNTFKKAYEKIGGANHYGEWVRLSGDGKSLRIDTNPANIEDYYDSNALVAVRKMNDALGLPSSLVEDMSSTRAIDGRQKKEYGHIVVSWTYHPDYGLEILYERN